MGSKERQMLELRQLRNAAKDLLRDDVAFLKGERGGQGVAPRLMQSAGDKARGAAGNAAEAASEHKLKIGTGVALGIGAFAAWIFRDRIEKGVHQALEFILDEGSPVQEDDSSEEQADDSSSTSAE